MSPTCTNCGKKMIEGFCIHGGEQYFCTTECLNTEMTEDEFNELYEDGGDCYYTEWEDDEQ